MLLKYLNSLFVLVVLPWSDHNFNSCFTHLFIQHYHSLYVPISE